MCGRYFRTSSKQRISVALSVGKIPLNFEMRLDLNITPGTFQPVIRNGKRTAEREIALMRSGAAAPLAESLTDFNTSAESILKCGTVAGSILGRLVPVGGFSIGRSSELTLSSSTASLRGIWRGVCFGWILGCMERPWGELDT
jgi:hypothetical protein